MEVENELWDKITSFRPSAELMPAVVIIQQLEPFRCIYMSERGLEELGINQKELQMMGIDYLNKFFNLEDSREYLEKLKKLLAENDLRETFTFFQQVRIAGQKEWIWHIGSTRIFFQDPAGKPTHIVTIAVPVNNLKHIPNKAERILAEKDFYRNNSEKFLTLSKRETQVLTLVAKGRSSPEISKELFISIQTVSTHRKAIKQKLGISSNYDFTIYAHAFDLI